MTACLPGRRRQLAEALGDYLVGDDLQQPLRHLRIKTPLDAVAYETGTLARHSRRIDRRLTALLFQDADLPRKNEASREQEG